MSLETENNGGLENDVTGNEAPQHLPLESKEDAMDLDLEVECHSEPLLMENSDPKPSIPSKTAGFSNGSEQLTVPAKTAASCNPSTAATNLVSQLRKNLASKMVPLEVKSDGSAPISLIHEEKMDVKKSQDAEVVLSMPQVQPTWQPAKLAFVSLTLTKPVGTAPVLISTQVRQPSTPLTAAKTSTIKVLQKQGTSAPVGAAKSIEPIRIISLASIQPKPAPVVAETFRRVPPTSIINVVSNQRIAGPLPLLSMNGLTLGSQKPIVTVNNPKGNQQVLTSSPCYITSTNSGPSIVTTSGYQVVGGPTLRVPPLTPLSPPPTTPTTSTSAPILRTYLRTNTNDSASKKTSTVQTTSFNGTTVSLKPTYVLATVPSSKPSVGRTVNESEAKKGKGDLWVREVLTPIRDPDGKMRLQKKTILLPDDVDQEINKGKDAKKPVVHRIPATVPKQDKPLTLPKKVLDQIIQPFSHLSSESSPIRNNERLPESFQWHQPCVVPPEPKNVEVSPMVTEESAQSDPEILPGPPLGPTDLFGDALQIVNAEVGGKTEALIEEIKFPETVMMPETNIGQKNSSVNSSTLQQGSSFKWHSSEKPPIEPVQSKIEMTNERRLPTSGSALKCPEEDAAAAISVEDELSMSSQDFEDDRSTKSQITKSWAAVKPESKDPLEFPKEEVRIKNDPDAPTVGRSNIGSTEKAFETVKRGSIKIELMSDCDCEVSPVSPPAGYSEKSTDLENPRSSSDVPAHIDRMDSPIHVPEDLENQSTADEVKRRNDPIHVPDDLENQSTADKVKRRNDPGAVNNSPPYPNLVMKWNQDHIRKIQLSLKRRLKGKGKGHANQKRKVSGHKEAPPHKSQKLNDNCNKKSSSAGCETGTRCLECIPRVDSNVLRDCIVRKNIQDSYSRMLVPTIKKIHSDCIESGLDVPIESVGLHLKSIGYNWVNCGSKELLIEDPRNITKRIEYLDQLEVYSGRVLVYLLVSEFVTKTETGWRTCSYSAWNGLGPKHIVLHAINNTSLIRDCLLVLTVDSSVKSRIREWLLTTVFPNIPDNSVIVVGDAVRLLTAEEEDRPHFGQSKEEIISWLKSHKVKSVDPKFPKAMLLSKAFDVVLPKTSIFDRTTKEKGFDILYLPEHHRDLNPMEFLWQDILDKLKKTPNILDFNDFRDFVVVEFSFCSAKASSVACYLVRKFEVAYGDFDFSFDKFFDLMTGKSSDTTDPEKSTALNSPLTSKSKKAQKPTPAGVNPNQQICEVCIRPAKLSKFRCVKCKFFWYHLVKSHKEGKDLPVCKMYQHYTSRPYTCCGCRRNQYELAYLKAYPDKPLPIPPVTFRGMELCRRLRPRNHRALSDESGDED